MNLNEEQLGKALLNAITETFIGANGDNGVFLRKQDPGLLPIMSLLTAFDASQSIAGTSIAAHVSHIIICLDNFICAIEGGDPRYSEWKEILSESQVDEAEWQVLREELEIRMSKLRRIMPLAAMQDENRLWAALGVLSHNAYHLGAIQVKIEQLRNPARQPENER
ncbi:MAG: hypothetical protein IJD04_08885 [Desulfovibrionaceae bacterium]|nr:hypothetical protein [Desulfovibrionaceae bacterium]